MAFSSPKQTPFQIETMRTLTGTQGADTRITDKKKELLCQLLTGEDRANVYQLFVFESFWELLENLHKDKGPIPTAYRAEYATSKDLLRHCLHANQRPTLDLPEIEGPLSCEEREARLCTFLTKTCSRHDALNYLTSSAKEILPPLAAQLANSVSDEIVMTFFAFLNMCHLKAYASLSKVQKILLAPSVFVRLYQVACDRDKQEYRPIFLRWVHYLPQGQQKGEFLSQTDVLHLLLEDDDPAKARNFLIAQLYSTPPKGLHPFFSTKGVTDLILNSCKTDLEREITVNELANLIKKRAPETICELARNCAPQILLNELFRKQLPPTPKKRGRKRQSLEPSL